MPDLDHFLPELIALGQVLMIDLVLAGDNAVVVGLAVAGLPPEQRSRAVLFGIGIATLLRIAFALLTVQLLAVPGLLLVGGLLLLWVCWRMGRDLWDAVGPHVSGPAPAKTMRQAMTQIVIADVSMSLDNVLAVAGASREHPWVLVVGLAISVVLMGAAARLVAELLSRYRWIGWAGLLVVLYVALRLVLEGGEDALRRLA